MSYFCDYWVDMFEFIIIVENVCNVFMWDDESVVILERFDVEECD